MVLKRTVQDFAVRMKMALPKKWSSKILFLHQAIPDLDRHYLCGPATNTLTEESGNDCFLQIRRHLGETLTDGLDHQFWYHVVLPEDERIKEGRLYLFGTKAPAQPTENDLWVPYLSMEEIIRSFQHRLATQQALYQMLTNMDSK